MHYTYCTTAQSVTDAVALLRRSPEIIVDTEGKSIGSIDGALSIISVGTSDGRNIFLFDVIALCPPNSTSTTPIQPLLDLLSNPAHIKLMWDGRNDNLELIETFGCQLTNVLDLQIVELVSRWEVEGEGEKERKLRLQRGHFGFAAVRQNPDAYEGMHLVSGMQKCVESFGIDKHGKDPTVKKMYKESGSDIWMERPLSDILLDYAAKDIELMAKLYPKFRSNDWLTKRLKAQVIRFSANYLQVRLTAGREVKDKNPFRQSALILEQVLYNNRSSAMTSCSKCHLLLPTEDCFETKFSKRRARMRRLACRRCVVLAKKSNMEHLVRDGWVQALL